MFLPLMRLPDRYVLSNVRDIKRLNAHFVERPQVAFDLETVNGEAYLFTAYDGTNTFYRYTSARDVTDTLIDYIESVYRKGLLVWAFNLSHDLPLCFPKLWHDFVNYTEFAIEAGDHRIGVVCDRVWYGNGRWKRGTYQIRDAMLFLHSSLDRACTDLKLPVKKLPKPDGLGSRRLRSKEFIDYALTDAIATWHLGKWIQERCKDQDVPVGVSLSDFAGRIFRRHFLISDEVIEQPNDQVQEVSLFSYHGGKTETYLDVPCVIPSVREYDITSAYPWLMSELPDFTEGEYESVAHFAGPWGVYYVQGRVDCPYTAVYDENFAPVRGEFRGWLTGYELLSAESTGCLSINSCKGYRFRAGGRRRYHPLQQFVARFYRDKHEARTHSARLVAKLILNSLYGKFIARVTYREPWGERWKCGSCFHPFIGSLITGGVRARMHDLEHRYNPVHVSTDSLMLRGSRRVEVGDQLGDLTLKARGDLVLFRKKLYMMLDPHDHGRVIKWAGHGYWGGEADLLGMYHNRRNLYKCKHMWRLREASKRKDEQVLPFTFQEVERELRVDWSRLTVYT